MTLPEDAIKKWAVERLDREATTHRSGHQEVHARRYVLPRPGSVGVEVMIVVKGNNLQLWCEAVALDRLTGLGLGGTFRPGSETYSKRGPNGSVRYGRHSALKTMGRLHRGDAWRFVPQTVGEVDRLIDALAGKS